MGLIIHPVSFILHAISQCGLPATVTLVKAPVSLISVAICARMQAFAVSHIPQRVTLRRGLAQN